jgi:acetaldehyde dehydrogenase
MAVDAAIVGAGNIDTELMYKILDRSNAVNLKRMIGVSLIKESEGL